MANLEDFEFGVLLDANETIAAFDSMPDVMWDTVEGLYYLELNEIFNESQQLVPVDTGTLKSSGAVTPPQRQGDIIEGAIGYGGAASSYAFIVHERLDTYHEPPTQAKYLAQPLDEHLPGMEGRIAEALRQVLPGVQ